MEDPRATAGQEIRGRKKSNSLSFIPRSLLNGEEKHQLQTPALQQVFDKTGVLRRSRLVRVAIERLIETRSLQ